MTLVIARRWKADGYIPSPEEYAKIVDNILEHRPWFDDALWEADITHRRYAVNLHLGRAFADGELWTVLRDGQNVGILLIERLQQGLDCTAHFIFFDRALKNKVPTCLDVMRSLFQRHDLEAIRTEVPTYASKLARFLRRALGFRFENEWRGAPSDASWGTSRKYHVTKYKGKWHDALLLSIHKDAFKAFYEEQHERDIQAADPTDRHDSEAGASGPSTEPPDGAAGVRSDHDSGDTR